MRCMLSQHVTAMQTERDGEVVRESAVRVRLPFLFFAAVGSTFSA